MQIGIAEAKDKFTMLLKIVEKGGAVVITRHGHPVAERRRLHPQPRRPGEDPIADLIDAL
jgi:antitoxin (DNA-binding transcriptional repressor) of toxin-antitoxin stability system